MKLTLHIWRQASRTAAGQMAAYDLDNVSPDMSFLEMLDLLNEKLVRQNQEPVAFDHDCREGICGSCAMMINGLAHGPERATTACQLHMRSFKDGDTITVEPWRAAAFPVLKDLVVDRGALDRIVAAGGFISAPTGSAPDGNAILVPSDSPVQSLAEIGRDLGISRERARQIQEDALRRLRELGGGKQAEGG